MTGYVHARLADNPGFSCLGQGYIVEGGTHVGIYSQPNFGCGGKGPPVLFITRTKTREGKPVAA